MEYNYAEYTYEKEVVIGIVDMYCIWTNVNITLLNSHLMLHVRTVKPIERYMAQQLWARTQ